MNNLTQTEIKAFGKILSFIGESIKENPQILEKFYLENKFANFNLYEFAKNKDSLSFKKALSSYTVKELKFLLTAYRLDGSNLKSKKDLIDILLKQFY